MFARLILGVLGAVSLVVGVFCPFKAIPILGAFPYIGGGRPPGVLVLLMGLGDLGLTLARRHRRPALLAAIAAVPLASDLYTLQPEKPGRTSTDQVREPEVEPHTREDRPLPEVPRAPESYVPTPPPLPPVPPVDTFLESTEVEKQTPSTP